MSDPVGVLVLADCDVQMEKYGDRPFVFSATFSGEEGRKHFFSGQSEHQCVQWVRALQGCGYSQLQSQLHSLQFQIKELTGSDPLIDRVKVPKQPRPGGVSPTTTKFYIDPSSDRQYPSTVTTPGPVVPTRRAPNRPAQPLIQLVEPAAADDAPVHATTMKPPSFSHWETFNWMHIDSDHFIHLLHNVFWLLLVGLCQVVITCLK